MDKSVKIENILSQIRSLDYEARLYLMEELIKQIRKNKNEASPSSHYLTELNRLGSEIWKGVNIDQYIQQERQWD